MALPTITGQIDPNLGYIVPLNSGTTWTSLSSSTWSTFGSWTPRPRDPLVWVSSTIDLGSQDTVNVIISTSYTGGSIFYDIYSSTTGLFQGEETVQTCTDGDTGLTATTGRYIVIVTRIFRGSSVPTLQSQTITTRRQSFDIALADVNTAGLSGSLASRTLNLGRQVSKILTVQLTARDPGLVLDEYFLFDYIDEGYAGIATDSYLPDGYVEPGYFGLPIFKLAWPYLVSKSSTSTSICMRDSDGDYVNGTIDALVRVLPEQYMQNGQLLTR